MKFELDTNAKTVKLLDDATLGEVSEVLKKVLGDEAKEYRLITTVNHNPVYVGRPYVVDPYVRWWGSPIYYGGTTTTFTGSEITTSSSATFVCETGTNGCLTVTNTAN